MSGSISTTPDAEPWHTTAVRWLATIVTAAVGVAAVSLLITALVSDLTLQTAAIGVAAGGFVIGALAVNIHLRDATPFHGYAGYSGSGQARPWQPAEEELVWLGLAVTALLLAAAFGLGAGR